MDFEIYNIKEKMKKNKEKKSHELFLKKQLPHTHTQKYIYIWCLL